MEQQEPYKDVLIEEVRERRRQVLADHGFDLTRLLETIQRRQLEQPRMYVDRRERPTKS